MVNSGSSYKCLLFVCTVYVTHNHMSRSHAVNTVRCRLEAIVPLFTARFQPQHHKYTDFFTIKRKKDLAFN